MMTLAGIELESLLSEPDALTTRPPPKPMRHNLHHKIRLTARNLKLN